MMEKKTFIIVSVPVTTLLFICSAAFFLQKPDAVVISRTYSPGGEWRVVVRSEEYGSSFGPILTSIYIEKNRFFGELFSKKILEFPQEQNGKPVTVSWRGSQAISIALPPHTDDISVRVKEYKNINIFFVDTFDKNPR